MASDTKKASESLTCKSLQIYLKDRHKHNKDGK